MFGSLERRHHRFAALIFDRGMLRSSMEFRHFSRTDSKTWAKAYKLLDIARVDIWWNQWQRKQWSRFFCRQWCVATSVFHFQKRPRSQWTSRQHIASRLLLLSWSSIWSFATCISSYSLHSYFYQMWRRISESTLNFASWFRTWDCKS